MHIIPLPGAFGIATWILKKHASLAQLFLAQLITMVNVIWGQAARLRGA